MGRGLFAPVGINAVDVMDIWRDCLVTITNAFWYKYGFVFVDFKRDDVAKTLAFA